MAQQKRIFAEAAGWYGAVAIMLAYVMVSFGLVAGESLTFQLLNLSGAIGIAIIASVKKVIQSVLLNTFWAIIALIAIAKIVL